MERKAVSELPNSHAEGPCLNYSCLRFQNLLRTIILGNGTQSSCLGFPESPTRAETICCRVVTLAKAPCSEDEVLTGPLDPDLSTLTATPLPHSKTILRTAKKSAIQS